MPNQFYSPNAKISGGALFASWNSKDGSIYLKVIKQIANNPNKIGNFDGKNPINVKLSQDEAADIIRAIRTNGESKFFHKFENDTCTGKFNYYELDGQNGAKRKGFGLTVKKNDKEIKMGFTLGSTERLSLFLQNALVHIFDAEYSEDLKKYKEAKAKVGTVNKIENPEESETAIPSTSDNADF